MTSLVQLLMFALLLTARTDTDEPWFAYKTLTGGVAVQAGQTVKYTLPMADIVGWVSCSQSLLVVDYTSSGARVLVDPYSGATTGVTQTVSWPKSTAPTDTADRPDPTGSRFVTYHRDGSIWLADYTMGTATQLFSADRLKNQFGIPVPGGEGQLPVRSVWNPSGTKVAISLPSGEIATSQAMEEHYDVWLIDVASRNAAKLGRGYPYVWLSDDKVLCLYWHIVGNEARKEARVYSTSGKLLASRHDFHDLGWDGKRILGVVSRRNPKTDRIDCFVQAWSPDLKRKLGEYPCPDYRYTNREGTLEGIPRPERK
ncbi:MAG: hypothetical protein AMXMBFR61_04270 [Fimbriimonadales bacterium]